MGQINGEQWQTFFIVCAAIIAAVVLLGNLVKTLKDWRKPSADLRHKVEEHDKFLASDKARIERIEADLRTMDKNNAEAQAVLMKAVLALLNHEIHNGNADEMQTAQKALMDYLTR